MNESLPRSCLLQNPPFCGFLSPSDFVLSSTGYLSQVSALREHAWGGGDASPASLSPAVCCSSFPGVGPPVYGLALSETLS